MTYLGADDRRWSGPFRGGRGRRSTQKQQKREGEEKPREERTKGKQPPRPPIGSPCTGGGDGLEEEGMEWPSIVRRQHPAGSPV